MADGASTVERLRGRVALAAAVAFAFVACLRKINDYDYWTHLAFGRAYVAAGTLSVGDPFVAGREAWAAGPRGSLLGDALSTYDWPFRLAIHGVESVLGHAGVSVAVALCAAAAAALLAAPLLRPAAPARTAAGVVFAAAAFHVARFRFSPRSEALAAVLLGGVLLLAHAWGRRPRWAVLAGLGALLLAWRPIHVSWALGAALAGVALAASPRLDFWRARSRAAQLAAAAAATLLAVPALRFAAFVVGELGAGGRLAAVSEMRPAWEFPAVGLPFLALAAAGGALAWGRREGRPARLAVWGVATLLGLVVVRNVGLAALAMIPGAVGAGEEPGPGRAPARAAPALAAVAVAGLLLLVLRDRDYPAGVGVDWRKFPRGAAAFVKARLEAPVFNTWGWGGYLAWAWGGSPRTFLDGRLGDRDLLAEHDAVCGGDPGPVVERRGFRTALLQPVWVNSGRLLPAVRWFLKNPGWRLVDASDGLVFARTPLPPGVAELPPAEAWRTVLRHVDLALEQNDVPVHAEFTRASALLELGDVAGARAAFERGRRAAPAIAATYPGLDAALARLGR